MAVGARAPVSEIEGIGPAASALLAEVGIFAVFDLLRADAGRIHAAVSDLASPAEARGWRQMAVLLQVRDVTPQWAEALVGAGVKTLAILCDKKLDELEAVFAEQRSAGRIPDVPSVVQIAEMSKDAASLEAAGALTGTVRDHRGDAVADALVRVGGRQARTDARGRFRVTRLRLGSPYETRIEHSDFTTLSERVDVVPSVGTIHVRSFTLQRRVGEPAGDRAVSTLRGDALPPMAGQPIVAREIERDELEELDVLRLILLYANGTEAKLVSRLPAYENGEFVLRWLRVALSELPPDPSLREHLWYRGGRFTRMRMSPAKLRAYLEFLRHKRARPAAVPGTEPGQAALDARLSGLQAAGTLQKRGRRGPLVG
jgi:hypothetical protein